jgi:general secretion pathway protein G
MLKNLVRRLGFSIAEILVALTIIAILAAVLIPGLSGHVIRSDAGRIASDLTVLQTAIENFASDVHRYPANITQLTTAITGTDTDVNGANYPTNLVPKWKGPYVNRDVFGNLGTVAMNSSFGTLAGANSITYVTITLTAVQQRDFANIEDILDTGTTSSTSSSAGIVRWSSTNSSLTFLAVPLI